MVPFFSAYSYTYSNFSSNDGSIINIVVTGGTPNVLVNISGPNGYNQNYIAPAIPDQLNLEPGTYTMSVVDGVGEKGNDVVIEILEKPETVLTVNINDACNCPDCDCVVTISDYVHNSNCFIYNLYDGTNPIPVATFEGCRGEEYHQFTGLCTGEYSVQAIELDEILYTYGTDTGDCAPGDLVFDETSDPASIVADWTRFAFFGNAEVYNGTINMPSGLDPVTGIISNAPGTYFERGNAFDLGDFNIPMTEGEDVGPVSANDPVNYYKYYFNTAINKYVASANTQGGLPLQWATFDPRADEGTAIGNPTACQFLTSPANWTTQALTGNQYTIDSGGNVVTATSKLTAFPIMINCINNSGFINGFYSVCNFNDYVHEITIGSTDNDDDNINIVIAAFKDLLGVWGPVDQTHTLQLSFNTTGGINIGYNGGSSAYAFTTPGSVAVAAYASPVCCATQAQGGWRSIGNIRVKIQKTGSIIEVFLTDTMGDTGGQQSNANVNVGGFNDYNPMPIFSFDLLDKNTWNPAVAATAVGDELAKFVTDIKIGYATSSQRQSNFFDIAFTGDVVVGITEEPVEEENAINVVQLTEPCELCYKATNCLDPSNTMLVTLPANMPALDLNVTYIFTEFPDECWTVEVSDECGGEPGSAILVNTGFIDAAENLGVEDQQDFNWELIQGDVPVPTPAIITNQAFPGYGSLFNALWINQLVSPHLVGISQPSIYETTFVLPVGFTPQLMFDLLSDVRAVVTLNGFIIADNSNPVTYPDPLGTPASFSTSNPIHFNPNPAINTLQVAISTAGEEKNGFALAGSITSMGEPLVSTPVTVQEIFIDCQDCLGVCYELIDCEGLLSPIQTSTDLSAYVGQVITLLTCPDTCWSVFEMPACPPITVEVYLKDSFTDCVTCLPSEPAPAPLEIKNRTVKPGYDTKGCSPAYVEKINCDWSESLFQQVASKRYGIQFCCSQDFSGLDIKKQLLDLKMITDPEACVTLSSACCPPCNVTAELITFTPATCPVPILVSAIFVPPPIIVGKDCRSALVNYRASKEPGPGTLQYVDCNGADAIVILNDGDPPETICIDVSQPFTANANIDGGVTGICS